MAGRFLFRKLSSRMSRSTSLLCAYASASEATVEPFTRCAWAARYFNTLPCTNAAYGTGSPASGMPSAVTLKPPFVSSVGVKRTFSSSTSTIDTISSKPKVPTSRAEWEAKWASDKAASEADFAAWSAKKDAETASFVPIKSKEVRVVAQAAASVNPWIEIPRLNEEEQSLYEAGTWS